MGITIQGSATANDQLPMVLWDNKFVSGTVTASTQTSPDGLAANAKEETTYNYWQATALPANLVVDLGSAQACDCFAIVGHNIGSSGDTVLCESSTDNVNFTTRCTVVPTDDRTILGIFASVSARYWRFRITGTGTPPIISCAWLGARLVFPGGVKPPYVPVWQAQKSEVLTSESMGGQFLGNRVVRESSETTINLISFTNTFMESTTLQGFKDHFNSGKAFIFASAPSVFTKDVGYLWRKENADFRPSFDENGLWLSSTMDVYAYAE